MFVIEGDGFTIEQLSISVHSDTTVYIHNIMSVVNVKYFITSKNETALKIVNVSYFEIIRDI